MASQGLKGYWGAEQLDRTGLPSWQLCLVMAVFAIALGNGLMVLIGMMEPNENAFVSDPDNDGRMARLVAMISIAQLYLVIALFRLFDKDLAVLPLADDLAGQCRSQLQSGRSLRLGCVAIGLVYGLLLFPVVISLVDARDPSLVQTFTYLADSGSAAVVCFVVTPLHGVITGMGLAMIVAQVRCLGHAANGISIDFLRLNECSALANPGVRLLVALIPLFCLLLLMRFLGDDPVGIAFLDQVLIFVTLFALLLILPFGYPVWVLRNRIRDAKADAMADVNLAIRGDEDALARVGNLGLGMPGGSADLLTHQMFLESRWEWPIGAHIQKLILFGFLPPLTWVLAAVIENLMY